MAFNNLTLHTNNGFGIVTVNRPKSLNALNIETLRELKEAMEELEKKVKVIALTGAGEKAFVAGADIAALRQMNREEASEFIRLGHEVMNTVENCKRPVIAAVNGFCLGGGLELALSCDFIYASDKANLGLPEVGLGLFPSWGGTQRLTRLLGKNKAKEVILTGGMLSAEEACRWGIVNRVCSSKKLLEETRATALLIAKKGPMALSMAKGLINNACHTTLREGLLEEQKIFSQCFQTEDLKEGLMAFVEKRLPKFVGR